MGQWTWLFAKYPLADIELVSNPIDSKTANVLVRTCRVYEDETGTKVEVRVAPHNTAPFRGGPWFHTFDEQALFNPGTELALFRESLASELDRCQQMND
ncbi:hypothetical protein [Alicyclobacillus ferrooxydans]|uniref:Uncharacterized protein n=1 Tax=Alicyclobacillus ferrooxydans TaxID=471514 RepID=A0A0P9EYQ5_9BACL|nr:hypothetical protein [Alicyclobacillus ferrooxydans]KPV44259.1 hypothetical protein AN477_08160 [Alicyclobacillus ferrooxydans]